MTNTTITVTMSTGESYKVRGQEDAGETRSRSYEWAARYVLSDREASSDFLQLEGLGNRRALLNRAQITSVVLADTEPTDEFWLVL